VPARDSAYLETKIKELEELGYPYIIICGEKVNHSNVIFREPQGKYDAINFGSKFVPLDTDIVVLNDVDTEIHNFKEALTLIKNFSLVFTKVDVKHGPQKIFYRFLDSLRKRIPIAASGELMLIKYDIFRKVLPLRRCKAEDSYILFKILELGGNVAFCQSSYVITKRTTSDQQEVDYKRRTVGGIYQALSLSKPPLVIRLFYMLLPFVCSLLLILGKRGYYWVKGILLGFIDYIRGDQTAIWKRSYS